jgi:hypothetical protein
MTGAVKDWTLADLVCGEMQAFLNWRRRANIDYSYSPGKPAIKTEPLAFANGPQQADRPS